jgi:hypothetical protein
VEWAEAAAKGLDLLLVGVLLALGQFNGFEHFLHSVERGVEGFDDVVDLFDGVGDSGWGGGLEVAAGRRGRRGLPHSRSCRIEGRTWLGELLRH